MSLGPDSADTFFTKAAHRASVLVGLLRFTPYQLGMVVTVIPMLVVFSYPVFWFNLASVAGKTRVAGNREDFLLSPFYVAVTLAMLCACLYLCGVSFRLCVKRQREWMASTRSGNLMSKPDLAREVLFSMEPGIAGWICMLDVCCEVISILLPVFHLDPSFGQTPRGSTPPAVYDAILLCQYCITLCLSCSYTHIMLADYLLLTTPRIRRSRSRSASRLPAAVTT